MDFEPNRTIIHIPDTKCVLVYNKYQEIAQLALVRDWAVKDGYIAKPLASLPELGIELYSRCFLCRMNESGNLESIRDEDQSIIHKYLAQ